MDIHKPRPWRGWPELLKEVGTIVIGVLIALGAEQVVEWLHWRHEAHLARDAIAFDLRRIVGQASAKDAREPCVARIYADYTDALEQAQVTRRLPPIAYRGSPGTNQWTLRSWYGLTSGQTLAHMSNHDQIILSSLEGTLEYARTLRAAQIDNLGVLDTIVGPGRPISDAEIASLNAALGRASRNESEQRGLGRLLEVAIVRSGFLDRAQAEAAYREGVDDAKASPVCRGVSIPMARSRDMTMKGLADPPKRLGEVTVGGVGVGGVGVGGALTTEK